MGSTPGGSGGGRVGGAASSPRRVGAENRVVHEGVTGMQSTCRSEACGVVMKTDFRQTGQVRMSEKPRKAYQKLLNIFEDDPRLTLHIRADIQLLAQVSLINL